MHSSHLKLKVFGYLVCKNVHDHVIVIINSTSDLYKLDYAPVLIIIMYSVLLLLKWTVIHANVVLNHRNM